MIACEFHIIGLGESNHHRAPQGTHSGWYGVCFCIFGSVLNCSNLLSELSYLTTFLLFSTGTVKNSSA
jgi:hypothetical protein